MAASNISGNLHSRKRVVEAFQDETVSNPDFIELFAATPTAEGLSALIRCRAIYRSTVVTNKALEKSTNSSDAAAAFTSNLEHWMQEHDLSERRLHELEAMSSQQEMALRQEIATISEQLEQCREQASQLQLQYSELQRRVESSQSHTLDDTAVQGGGGGCQGPQPMPQRITSAWRTKLCSLLARSAA